MLSGASVGDPAASTLAAVPTLAERMRQAIELSGLSARRLSLAAGLSQSHVGQLARGTTGKNPSYETLRAIAQAAKVSPRWLAEGIGTPHGPDPDGAPSIPPRPSTTLADDPNWPELLAAARASAPGIPAWVWVSVAGSSPVADVPVTPRMVVAFAQLVADYGIRPRGR